MGDIRAHLPAEAALDVYHLLDQLAAATAGLDDRPVTARRADALTDLCTALLTDGHVDITALLNLHDGSVPAAAADEPSSAVQPPDDSTPTNPTTEHRRPETGGGAPGSESPATRPTPARQRSIAGTRHGRPVHLNLTMSLAAFAGIGRDPAVLTGHGAITADLAAAIA